MLIPPVWPSYLCIFGLVWNRDNAQCNPWAPGGRLAEPPCHQFGVPEFASRDLEIKHLQWIFALLYRKQANIISSQGRAPQQQVCQKRFAKRHLQPIGFWFFLKETKRNRHSHKQVPHTRLARRGLPGQTFRNHLPSLNWFCFFLQEKKQTSTHSQAGGWDHQVG